LIVWPPAGPRELVLTILLIALAGVGIEALRRKTLREFPAAQRGDWVRSMRERFSRATTEAGRRMGAAMRGLTHEERHPVDAKLDHLERLGELKEKGLLTASEFRDEKKKVLSG
jgi:hypothetical protein